MRLTKFMLSFVLSLGLASTVFAADTQPFAELGASWTDPDLLEESQHVSGLVRGGIEMTSWAAFEVEAILGLDKAEEVQSDGDEFEAGLDSQFGGFVRLGIPIEKQFLPYIRIGYAVAQTSVTRTRIRDGETEIRETEDSFSGPALGFGLQGFFGESRQNGVRLDFLALIAEGDDNEFFDILDGTSNISVTYVRRF